METHDVSLRIMVMVRSNEKHTHFAYQTIEFLNQVLGPRTQKLNGKMKSQRKIMP